MAAAGHKTALELTGWVAVTVCATVVVLVVLLWSAQRGRKVHLRNVGKVGDNLREALPSLTNATHGHLVEGNQVEILQNGDGFWPRLLADIAAARYNVHFESYVWWKGDICRQVAEALAAKAREGLEVRLLLDASGSSRMDKQLLAAMKEAGVQVSKYRPLRISNLARMNSRDHRKILVVDGRVGYVFGHGVADEWVGNAQDAQHWRDTAARAVGPIVLDLQAAFSDNWVEETGEVLAGEPYFPVTAKAGNVRAHVAYLFQHGSISAVDLLHRLVFAAAKSELWIQNPYLAADDDVVELLVGASKRGVDVRIMLPGQVTDSQFVRHAGHRHFDRLLSAGVRIYEYGKTLNHQKVMVVDRGWSHVGSTNLDNRSFESNDEISLGIFDSAIAEQLRQAFLADLEFARPLTLELWRGRSRFHKIRDRVAWQLEELL
jgi:cardiolipin synthase